MAKPQMIVVKFVKDTPDGFKEGDAIRVYPRLAADLLNQGFIEDYREPKEGDKKQKAKK